MITDLTFLLDGRLWPGYTLASHPLLVDAAGEALYCIGRCVPGLAGPLRANEIAGRFTARYSFVPGIEVGLADERAVLAVRLDPNREDLKDIVLTAIHEGFHAYYQVDRENDVPLEMRLPGNPQSGAYASRAELQNAYTTEAERNGLLSREIRALAWAARAGAEKHTEDVEARACVDEFIELRRIRHRDLPTPVMEEDIWERTEGIPLYLERTAATLLGRPDTSVLGQTIDYGVVPDLSMVPYFSITGALEAVILDQLTRDEWRSWVFPGRSGEGLTLFDAVGRARSSLPPASSTPCPANAGAQS
ncbi:MAG: hypothetical protein DMF56_18010 [Acidobacteria bacterium]|nr:MAG: hypothetical protein DMF56_18010 [Acidobacteriota bacterium]